MTVTEALRTLREHGVIEIEGRVTIKPGGDLDLSGLEQVHRDGEVRWILRDGPFEYDVTQEVWARVEPHVQTVARFSAGWDVAAAEMLGQCPTKM